MLAKFFYGALFVIAIAVIFVSPSYCQGELGIEPPANWASTGPQNVLTGTFRTISGVLPGDWKENNEYADIYGTCSNKVFYNADTNRYRVQISLSGPLSSGANTIPASNMQYIITYVYAYYGVGDPNNGEGQASYNNKSYVDFSLAPATVYTSTVQESAANVQGQFQFKYAVKVPDNQAVGTYNGTINYRVIRDDTSAVINSGSVSIRVVVGSLFRLSVDRGSIDFEKMKPGETKDNVPVEGVIVTGKTNTGNPWYLKISNDSPLSSGPYTIPNTNFIWYGWTDGAGTWYGTGTNQLTFVPDLVYSSAANESNNMPNGTNSHLKFKLTIPKGQPGGKYLSNVKLTLTE
jgi:hypothetical protein